MKTLKDRFMAHVNQLGPNECWLWLAYKDNRGRGYFTRAGKTGYAAQAAYDLFVGPRQPGLEVCHNCNNPSCVNPKHLRLDTHKSNMEDMVKVGKSWAGDNNPSRKYPEKVPRGANHHWYHNQNQYGADNPNAKLSQTTVDAIRQMYEAGAGGYIKLGQIFGINPWTIRDVVKQRRWGRV